jgi:hypothetical protein
MREHHSPHSLLGCRREKGASRPPAAGGPRPQSRLLPASRPLRGQRDAIRTARPDSVTSAIKDQLSLDPVDEPARESREARPTPITSASSR